MTIDELRAQRIGLVLSGGGAKGAYQIGCWKTLRKYEINRFAAVAGSSVGALNAILIATGKFDTADQLWRTISVWKVLRFDLPKLIFVPLLPLWLLCVVFRIVTGGPIRDWDPESRARRRAIGLWLFIFSLFTLPTLYPEQLPLWNVMALLIALSVLGPLVRWIILNAMFITNSPLAKSLKRELSNEDLQQLKVPAYATLARFRQEVPQSMFQDRAGWFPDYVRLDKLGPGEVLEVLLQSAAIPGFFPVRNVLGDEAVDGGWCDNVPLAPLLYDPEVSCDQVFVIHLETYEKEPPTLLEWLFRPHKGGKRGLWPWEWVDQAGVEWIEKEAKDNWEAFLESKERKVVASIGDWIPPTEPSIIGANADRKPRVIHVVPSKPLGGFIDGTLRFSRRKARELMELGESDMEAVIKQLLANAVLPSA